MSLTLGASTFDVIVEVSSEIIEASPAGNTALSSKSWSSSSSSSLESSFIKLKDSHENSYRLVASSSIFASKCACSSSQQASTSSRYRFLSLSKIISARSSLHAISLSPRSTSTAVFFFMISRRSTSTSKADSGSMSTLFNFLFASINDLNSLRSSFNFSNVRFLVFSASLEICDSLANVFACSIEGNSSISISSAIAFP